MLPNFTVVICGAVLTVMMLAVTGSGLIMPETRTRIGEMPEVGRPMMQRMIAQQAGQAQLAVLDLTRRAEELGRLRDLVAPALVAAPAPAVLDDEPAQEKVQEATQEATRDASPAPDAVEHPDAPAATAAPAIAAAPVVVPVPAPVIVAAVAPAARAPAPQEDGARADPPTTGLRAPAEVDAIEAMIPGAETGPQSVAALAETEEVVPAVRIGGRLKIRLPRGLRGAKATVVVRKPVRHAVRRPHRHARRAYAVHSGPPNPFGLSGTQFR